MTGLHVVPANDEKRHTCMDCECNPEVLYADPETGEPFEERMIVHNAFDHREAVEEVTNEMWEEGKHWMHIQVTEVFTEEEDAGPYLPNSD